MKHLKTLLLVVVVVSLVACGGDKGDKKNKEAKKDGEAAKKAPADEKKTPAETPETEDPTPKTEDPDPLTTDPPVPPADPPVVDPPVVDPPVVDPPVGPAIVPPVIGVPTDPPVGPVVDPQVGVSPTVDPPVAPPKGAPPKGAPPKGAPPVIPPTIEPEIEEPPKPEPKEEQADGGRAINLKLADSGKTISAGVGDVIIIELEGNPTTGYTWDAKDQPEGSVLSLTKSEHRTFSQLNPEMEPMVGQGGMTQFVYKVSGEGKAEIALEYHRDWEDKEPAESFGVTIEAAKKESPTVTGKIIFSAEPDVEQISRIVVSIRNTALADAPAPLIGTVELKPPFELPITYAVPYDPAGVRPNPMFYSISVRVNTLVDGSEKLYYINDTHHPVFQTADDTKVDVEVKKLR